jgi:uncharacterized cofD-like protein
MLNVAAVGDLRKCLGALADPENPLTTSFAAVEAIERADVVVIGPGSLFTSVLAACVVPGITQALAGSRARTIFVANLRPQLPETAAFTLADHVDALARHGATPDVVLVDERSAYAAQDCSLAVVLDDVARPSGLAHDADKLARALSRQLNF